MFIDELRQNFNDGETVVIILSFIFGIFWAVLSKAGGLFLVIIVFIFGFMGAMTFLAILHWIIEKLYEKSATWSFLIWLFVLLLISIGMILIIPVVKAFILGYPNSIIH